MVQGLGFRLSRGSGIQMLGSRAVLEVQDGLGRYLEGQDGMLQGLGLWEEKHRRHGHRWSNEHITHGQPRQWPPCDVSMSLAKRLSRAWSLSGRATSRAGRGGTTWSQSTRGAVMYLYTYTILGAPQYKYTIIMGPPQKKTYSNYYCS